MAYRSSGLYAIECTDLNLIEDEMLKLNELVAKNNEDDFELAVQLLKNKIKDKYSPFNLINFRKIMRIWQQIRKLQSIEFDEVYMLKNIFVFEFKYWKYYTYYSDVIKIENVQAKLDEIKNTNTHFIRLGEDYNDMECYGTLSNYFWISREYVNYLKNN